MSRRNKVNPDHYKTAGRLTTDDLARERQKQRGQGDKPSTRRGRAAPKPRSSTGQTKPAKV